MANFNVVGIGGLGGNVLNHALTFPENTSLRLAAVSSNELLLGKFPIFSSREENWQEKLLASLDNTVILIAGLGGSTGTSLSQHLAEQAKSQGKTVIAAVTTPFPFEPARGLKAEHAIQALKRICDDVWIFPNNDILQWQARGMPIPDCFAKRNGQIVERILEFVS